MRLLLVIDGMHPRDGGPPRVVGGSACALAARGHDVTVITTVRTGDRPAVEATWAGVKRKGVRMVAIPPVGPASLLSDRHLPAALTQELARADVVHMHGIWSSMLLGAGRWCRRHSIPYMVSVHGLLDDWSMRQSRWKKRAAIMLAGGREFLADADAVVFGTESEAREANYLPDGARVVAIANGTQLVTRGKLNGAQRELLMETVPQFGSWKRSILFFSRIHPKKGLDLLIDAFSCVADQFPDTGLLVAGIAEDASYEADLRRRVSNSPARDRIVITTAITGPDSQFLLDACDIFALPTHQEGFSMAVIEAMAHGKPLVITDACRLPEVETAGAGRVVAASVQGLRDALNDMLSRDDAALTKASMAARAIVERKYSWDRIAQQLEELYCGELTVCSA